jgi:hypothetical protein
LWGVVEERVSAQEKKRGARRSRRPAQPGEESGESPRHSVGGVGEAGRENGVPPDAPKFAGARRLWPASSARPRPSLTLKTLSPRPRNQHESATTPKPLTIPTHLSRPTLCVSASVLPSAHVTRRFSRHGRAWRWGEVIERRRRRPSASCNLQLPRPAGRHPAQCTAAVHGGLARVSGSDPVRSSWSKRSFRVATDHKKHIPRYPANTTSALSG